MIPDYSMGVENNEEHFYSAYQSMFTNFEYTFIGNNMVDMEISVDVKDLLSIDLEKLSDFEINASFLNSEKNYVDTQNGAFTNGVYRDKTYYKNGRVYFQVSTIGHLFDPQEKIEFIFILKKNSIQGTLQYLQINEAGGVNLVKEVNSVKQKNSVKTQYGIGVSLSSTRIYAGNSIIGDWPIDQIVGFDDDIVVSFDKCSHIFSQRGDIVWGNLQKNDTILEGSIISYDIKTIRDGDRVYIGNIFYKNGVAVITEQTEYFQNILKFGGRRGFEIKFDGINSIYENEILCKVNPYEFTTSTNPSSVIKRNIAFDVNDDNKFES